MKVKKLIMGVVAAMLLVWAMPAAGAEKSGKVQIEGSTTVGPLVDAFAEAFMQMYPEVKITVKKTGSGDGAAALVDSRCDIATMSRFMKPEEFKKAVEKGVLPVAHAIAMDGVCIVVHRSNPVSELTREQVHDIYVGKIVNWKELGGPDRAIVAVSRDTSSGTFEVFNEHVMKKDKLAGSVETVNANPQAHARVSTTEGGIGYVGLGFVDDKVKAVKVDGVAPTAKTIVAGQYSISRPLYLFTNGYPALGSLTYEFCTFYLTEKGQDIIKAKGFIPFTNY